MLTRPKIVLVNHWYMIYRVTNTKGLFDTLKSNLYKTNKI